MAWSKRVSETSLSVSEVDTSEKRLLEHLFNMIQVDRNVYTMFNFLPECKSSPDSNHPCYYTFFKHVVSDGQIVINGFIFLLSMKCFMTVDGQVQKVTDKLNWNMQMTMCHVVFSPHLLVTEKSKKYKTSDCSLNFRVHMFMKGALKIQ